LAREGGDDRLRRARQAIWLRFASPLDVSRALVHAVVRWAGRLPGRSGPGSRGSHGPAEFHRRAPSG
jgi:hypothetical protein